MPAGVGDRRRHGKPGSTSTKMTKLSRTTQRRAQGAVAARTETSTPRLTTKRKLLLSGLADGKSMAEATAGALMSRQHGYATLNQLRERLSELMDAIGLSERAILERLRDKLDATKTVTASFMGKITDSIEVADNPTQMDAIKTAAKMHGMFDRDDGPTNVGPVNIVYAGSRPNWLPPSPQPPPNQPIPLPAWAQPNGEPEDVIPAKKESNRGS